MHEKEGLGPLPSEEKLDLGWKILEEEVWSEWKRFWEVMSQERSSEMSLRSREPFIYKLNNSRQIKRCREVSSFKGFDKCSYRAGVQGKKNLDGSRIYWGAVERTKCFSIDQPSYREVSRSCWDCLKTVFQRREKHKHECNQTCNSTKDPNNILNSQNHLSTKKC